MTTLEQKQELINKLLNLAQTDQVGSHLVNEIGRIQRLGDNPAEYLGINAGISPDTMSSFKDKLSVLISFVIADSKVREMGDVVKKILDYMTDCINNGFITDQDQGKQRITLLIDGFVNIVRSQLSNEEKRERLLSADEIIAAILKEFDSYIKLFEPSYRFNKLTADFQEFVKAYTEKYKNSIKLSDINNSAAAIRQLQQRPVVDFALFYAARTEIEALSQKYKRSKKMQLLRQLLEKNPDPFAPPSLLIRSGSISGRSMSGSVISGSESVFFSKRSSSISPASNSPEVKMDNGNGLCPNS